jgi:4-oxalomesaconate tautomerase
MKIPYYHIRGGSSKGLYFKAEDLPSDVNERNKTLLIAMEGSILGDSRQIDGLGGGTSLTSKVAIVSKSKHPDCDLDYLFIQVVVGKGKISTTQTCGNILAGVLHFAIETEMIKPTHPTTSAKINMVNTGGICELTVETPNSKISTSGIAKVDGVVGTSAPILCNYLDTAGASCGSLMPTGKTIDVIDGIETTCIDNGMPVVIMRAGDFGLHGYESKEELDTNTALKNKIESIRLKAGHLMNLGDVAHLTIPKMCLVSAPQNGGTVNTRMFIPHEVHEAIGVLAAVSVGMACCIPNTTCFANIDPKNNSLSIEHPTGEMTVDVQYEMMDNEITIHKSGVIRTARILSRGEVYIP